MRRILSIVLFLTLLWSVAIADVLTIDLETATIEELKEAKQAIDHRISELSQPAANQDNSYTVEGKGTDIRPVNISLVPLSRFLFTCSDGEASYTVTVNGEEKKWIGPVSYFETATDISNIMVQSKSPWHFDFSPIGYVDSPFIAGNGNYVSDRFMISSPSIISVTFDYSAGGGNYWNENCSLVIYEVDDTGSVTPHYLISAEQVYEGKSITLEAIVNLDNQSSYAFWGVQCNSKIKWSITAKD